MAEPKEHITDEQIEKLFKLADEIVRAPSRFTKDFVVENLALGVADLCGVIDRLRAQLAETGETREEWGLRWLTAGGRYAYEPCDDEQEAREADPGNGLHEVVKRLAGEWREVPDA